MKKMMAQTKAWKTTENDAANRHEDGSSESNDEDDDDDSDVRYRLRRNTRRTDRRVRYVPSFKDVEESMTTFSGDDKRSIKRWISDFEETAEMCEWTGIQKAMYARRLLRGSAKLFVNYEKCGKSWNCLKSALRSEFGDKVCSHKIHRELQQRKKQDDESYQEYTYKMLDIASQADVDTDSVIRYIIDGIRDEEANKVILYGAKSIGELKKRFVIYEELRNNMKAKAKRPEDRTKKPVRVANSGGRICFNCGLPDHISANCPVKDKGLKCFNCHEHGHIASKCPKKVNAEKKICSVTELPRGKHYKQVKIAGRDLIALIDSGSDLCLMRADEYVKIGAPRLRNNEILFRGVGSDTNKTLGEFSVDITIDNNTYPITIRVISSDLMQQGLILGTDFINTVDVSIKTGKLSISKPESDISPGPEVAEIFKIDDIREVNKIDVSYIADAACRSAVEDLVVNYRPIKEQSVGIKMKLILKGRRTSVSEGQKVIAIGARGSKGSDRRMVSRRNNSAVLVRIRKSYRSCKEEKW